MNILILSNIEAGGEWIATQTLIQKLKKKDSSIKFHLISTSKNKYLLKEELFEQIIFIKNRRSKKPFKNYRELFYQISSGKKEISDLYKQHYFNRVVTTNYILALSYIMSQKDLNYIYLFHGIINNYRIFFDTFRRYLIFRKILEIFTWGLSNKLIIPSSHTKNTLIEHSLSLLKYKKMTIIPNLIRDEFKKDQKRQDKNIILYSGRLAYDKGIENLISAFLFYIKKRSKTVLKIVYPGKPDFSLIKNHRNIIYIKDPTVKELSYLYQTSTLAVLPSPFEISSLFIREALMCNLPIISTQTGDADDILPEQFILKDHKVGTIQNKIDDFFENIRRYQNIFKTTINKFKSRYNEKTIIDDWLNIFQEI